MGISACGGAMRNGVQWTANLGVVLVAPKVGDVTPAVAALAQNPPRATVRAARLRNAARGGHHELA